MDKKKELYSWLVPLLGAVSLICFVVWVTTIGHQGFFGIKIYFGDVPPEVLTFGLFFWGYAIPVILFGYWFGLDIFASIKNAFTGKKSEADPNSFELLDAWKKIVVYVVLAVGLYAIPMLIVVVVVLCIGYFVLSSGGSGIGSGSSSGQSETGGYASYSEETHSVNNELESTYQHTSGILDNLRRNDTKLSDDQKRDLKIATENLDHHSSDSELKAASQTIQRIANEIGATKDPYYKDRGEITILDYPTSSESNKQEFISGIKKDIGKITDK